MFVLLCLFGASGVSFAQINRDSLVRVIQGTQNGKEQADLLLQLSQSYMLESAVEVRRYALQALEVSDSIGYQEGLVKALSSLTWASRTSGDYSQALDYASKCLQAAEVISDKAGIAAAKYEMAAVYQAQKNYKNSRLMFIEARPYFEAVRDTYGIGKCFNGIGESYRWQQKWDSALTYYGKAERYFSAINHRKGMVLLKGNRGLVYAGQKQYQKALDTLAAVKRAAANENFISVVLESSIEMSRILMTKGDFGNATVEATRSQAIADSLGLRKYVHDAAVVLYEMALKQEDFETALEHQRVIYETEAKMNSEEVSSKLSNLDFEMRMRGKESEIEGLQKDKRIRSLWQSLLGVLLFVAFVIFILMAYAYRRNRMSAKLLARQYEQLEELNREKDSLLNIVAHDLKSPLSKVKALSAMVGMAGPLTEKQQTAHGMIGKVVSDAEQLIQDLLDISYAEATGNALKVEAGELNQLIKDWMGQHRENAAKKRIQLNFEPSATPIPLQTDLSYIARIFDNLFSNAIKYTPLDRQVTVRTWEEQGKFGISIHDQGPGINKEDQERMFRKFQRLSARPTAGEHSTGLGLSIIKTLTERLSGKVFLESSSPEGSTFVVLIPTKAQQA